MKEVSEIAGHTVRFPQKRHDWAEVRRRDLQDPDSVRTPQSELPGSKVRPVSEFHDCLFNASSCCLTDGSRSMQESRDGLVGHPGKRGDIVNRRWMFRRFHADYPLLGVVGTPTRAESPPWF